MTCIVRLNTSFSYNLTSLNLYYNGILCYKLFEYFSNISKRIYHVPPMLPMRIVRYILYLYESRGLWNFANMVSNETAYNTSLQNFIVILYFIERILNMTQHIHIHIYTCSNNYYVSEILLICFVTKFSVKLYTCIYLVFVTVAFFGNK